MRRLLILLLLALPLAAQKKVLTFDALYDPDKRIYFSGAVQSDFDWIDDSTFLWPKTDEKGDLVEYRLFDVKTGRARPLFERAKMQTAFEAAGVAAEKAKAAAESDELKFDASKSAVVLSIDDDLYVYSFTRNTVTRLTNAAGEEEEATFSPDGQKVAFVRGNNLFVVELSGRERQLTTDGSKEILNGKLDYVYQEEVYGRGIWKGYWWSPDSSRIAYLQLDERPVPEFTIADHIPYRLALNVYDYPKAGDPNPKVKLFVANARGGGVLPIDTSKYADAEHLIVNVAWRREMLTYQVQNREQTWLDLVFADANSGGSRTILRDTTKAWVDPIANPVWLADDTFLWQSERSGFRHVYRYKRDGTLVKQLTNGQWEVRELHGADATHAYFSGTERTVLGQDVYRIKLDGTGLQRLSSAAGTHVATFNPSLSHYVDKWSDIRTPDQVRVHRSDGAVAHVVDENRVPLAEYDLPQPEFLQVKTRDGFVMEAILIKPPNFDPQKKYPVYQHLYGGPHAQRVRNYWDTNATRGLFHHLVAQQGVIVWICDNRTASGKGAVSAWPAYKNFGESELRDIEDGIAWLKQQPYVDGDRIMLSGWSYGGFMVAYAMTHSKTFAAGVSGAPVTDWRDYDSIYTERLMLMPQNNEEGYRKASPRFDAKDLHGKLLLIHGTTDDNVHVQNTIQFAWELQQLGIPFEMMLYPRTKHSVTDRKTIRHMQKTVLDFVRRTLLD